MDKRRLAGYAYHNCEFVHAINLLKGEALSPALAAVHVKSLCELDETRAAVECAQRYLEGVFPDDGGLLYLLGTARYLAGDPRSDVEAAFLASAERRFDGAQIGLAFLEFAAGRTENARQLLEFARPNDDELEHVRLLSLFSTCVATGSISAAEDALKLADRLMARSPSLLRQYWGQLCWVRLLTMRGSFEAARAVLPRILDQLDEHLMPRLHRNALTELRLITQQDDAPTLNLPPERRVSGDLRPGASSQEAALAPALREITRKPMLHALFSFLSRCGDKGATKEDIVTGVWEENYNPLIHDDRIYKAVGRLRRLLGDDQQSPKYLVQLGRAYILNLPAGPDALRETL